ncbi:MAG: hypothetical protein A4S16_00050 [Proteobacteria bacterium SG_bin6]|nr:MAG: hypothetical protein A4S16_00050 [Proteobacteria bacterium SG_bin6]
MNHEALLAEVRARALALPNAAEKLSHGSPGFFVQKGKFFAYFWHDHHGDGRTAVLVKTSGREEQSMLCEVAPEDYFIPPYLGPSGWVGLRLDGRAVDWAQVEHRLRQSWERAAPPALLRGIETP